ncbi:MAG: hypothetical protein Q7U63_05825 [Polaromonas sp.]|uniref:hypothetical protein n=1 Tax=Polaromonas sp. TaxID=1869339 RepID=UPI0027249BEF|nr:hypothetical protein [Polaromonas sp.]MDO9113298.1 hypothetical protein [Polaromonas sp.]MDP1887859.1 hypothetical protein [Polaromonas sp.]
MTGFSDFRGALLAASFLPGTGLDMAGFPGFSSWLLAVFLTAGRAAALAGALGGVTVLAVLLDF